ncbi:class IIb bacteriocin, lactobin A/cerein 7B family [Salinispirillum sp. LH 10-3-1]|uniref:Class IIb bacteriocin, lactobin A/cerein 7B family n=1 Tax=Salinispirillum sp. LH 10-3-1 TaxID=2952525 RepID=A0AB38YDB1_9GAMM
MGIRMLSGRSLTKVQTFSMEMNEMKALNVQQVEQVNGGWAGIVVAIGATAVAANVRHNNVTNNAIRACGEGNVKSASIWGFKCK